RREWGDLTAAQRLEWLRVVQLALIRTAGPDDETARRLGTRLAKYYPTDNRRLNSELCQVLGALEAPNVVPATLALVRQASTQEEQLDYLKSLRCLNSGWTEPNREEYFRWLQQAQNFRGGASLMAFVEAIRTDALAHVDETQRGRFSAQA